MSSNEKSQYLKKFIGSRYGRVIIIGYIHEYVSYRGKVQNLYFLKYLCDCGNISRIESRVLLSRKNQSCGCSRKDPKTHGLTMGISKGVRKISPEYGLWRNIKDRCYNKHNKAYSDYGGRGIKMDEKWRNDYALFLKDVGERPSPNYSLDRINNNGNYEPGNVRWATKKEQANNTRGNRTVTIGGKKVTFSSAEEILGFPKGTLVQRITNRGWSEKEAVSTPIIKRGFTRANPSYKQPK